MEFEVVQLVKTCGVPIGGIKIGEHCPANENQAPFCSQSSKKRVRESEVILLENSYHEAPQNSQDTK